MPRKVLGIIAAADRFNYGDLLFPILMKWQLAPRVGDDYDLRVYGLVRSALGRWGAEPTEPLRRIFDRRHFPDGSVALIAGGQALPASWSTLHGHLDHPSRSIANLATRVLGERRRDEVSRRLLGGRTPLPFLVSPADFRADVRTAYNTIGCSRVANLSEAQSRPIAEALERASFVSVRERASRDAVVQITAGRRVPELAPDSAMLMCRMMDPERLDARIGEATRRWIERRRGRFACFQVSRRWLGPHAAVLAGQLDQLQRRHGLEVLLLPIGRAREHDDVAALAAVRRHMPRPAALRDDLSVWEIMALIAASGLFVGTSLHGAVTAQAFAVPHVGLFPRQVKLAEYLRQWDIPGQQECATPSQVAAVAERAMSVPAGQREARRDELVAAYEQTFERMAAALGLTRRSDRAVPPSALPDADSAEAPSGSEPARPYSAA